MVQDTVRLIKKNGLKPKQTDNTVAKLGLKHRKSEPWAANLKLLP